MLRNVIFDLGGVVLEWKPEEMVRARFSDHAQREMVLREVFQHEDWIELDRGTLDQEQAIENAVQRTGLSREVLTDLYNGVPRVLTPIPQTIELMGRIKANGTVLLVLSNMHVKSIEHLEKQYSFFELFDGGVVSCRVQRVKPEPEIFRLLLSNYRLKAEETLFIDDTLVNVEAAGKIGMETIHFRNAEQCEKELETFGVI